MSSPDEKIGEPPFAGASVDEIYDILISPGDASGLPRWPEESVQKRFTGGSGLILLRRAAAFVDMLDKDGAFARHDWKGLDFGCGWGRIASYLLAKGTPDQLDMCDAWSGSLDLARSGGFKNRIFAVSDVVRPGELPSGEYDFCYAMSIFTHLNREAFETNIDAMVDSLKIGGKLYFTVRHETFLEKMAAAGRTPPDAALEQGFWHMTYPNRTHYGETAIDRSFIDHIAERHGEIAYLGVPEVEQHLYRITRSA